MREHNINLVKVIPNIETYQFKDWWVGSLSLGESIQSSSTGRNSAGNPSWNKGTNIMLSKDFFVVLWVKRTMLIGHLARTISTKSVWHFSVGCWNTYVGSTLYLWRSNFTSLFLVLTKYIQNSHLYLDFMAFMKTTATFTILVNRFCVTFLGNDAAVMALAFVRNKIFRVIHIWFILYCNAQKFKYAPELSL